MQPIAFYLLLLMPLAQYIGSGLPDILLSTIAVLFIIRSIRNKDVSWLHSDWLRVGVALWLYLVIRSLFAEDYIIALKASLPWIRFIVFAAAVANWLLITEKAFTHLVKAIAITLLLISLNTISQFLIGADVFGNKADYAAYPRLFAPSGKLAVGIMTSFYILPLISATMLKYRNPFNIIAAVFAFITIFISGERTALILTVMGICLVAVFAKKARMQTALIAVIILSITAGIYVGKKEVIERQIVSSYQSLAGYPASSYGIISTTAIAIFSNNNYVFGVGPRHYKVECGKIGNNFMTEEQIKSYCSNTGHPHNIYLEMLVDGVVGFALFIIFVYCCIRSVFNPRSRPHKHFFCLGAGLFIMLKLFPFAPISSIYFAWSMAPFWLMLGAVNSYKEQEKEFHNIFCFKTDNRL